MTIEITKKIVGYEVVHDKPDTDDVASATGQAAGQTTKQESKTADIIQMHERLERPEMLLGSTYKIKTPLSEHALYITVNDIVLNPGTRHEMRRPYEIFINSKNMDHFQWIVALTRIISAVFRKGGDITFLVDELRSVFDPRGGYFKKGGRFKPSLVAEIGDAIECHLKMIGMIESPELDQQQKDLLDAKRKEFEAIHSKSGSSDDDPGEFPVNASLCSKCHHKAVVSMDGCMTCLNCADSKCG